MIRPSEVKRNRMRCEEEISRLVLYFFFVILVAAFGAAAAFGQAVNGSIVGTVKDSSGGVVPGAKVTVTNTSQNVSRSAKTDHSGNYSFPDVAPGTYKVAVEMPGFAKAVRDEIPLAVNSTDRVDMTLRPGEVTQTITVSEHIPILQTESAKTGGTIVAAQAAVLPLSRNRNFQNLVGLVPGATGSAFNHSRFFNPQNSLNNEVNGTSSMANNFQIEGVNDNERTGLLQVYVPAIEALQNVDVTTGNYDAEQGTALGAVVNVIYKSGTNKFHGEAYEIYAGNALDTRSFFDRGPNGAPYQRAHSVNNYWGGNFGGPIRKDKTFFFVNFLRTTDHEGQNQRLSVPTLAMRGGDFSDPALTEIFDPATGDTADCLPGGVSANCGKGRTQFFASSDPTNSLYNPACTAVTPTYNAATGNCANIIPSNRIDPISGRLVALVPQPNNNQSLAGLAKYSQNYYESTRFTQDNYQIDVKIDQYQGDRDHISGHLGFMNPKTLQAPAYGMAGGPVAGAFQGTGTDKTYSAAINWDHTFSSTLIMQNRIGLNRYRNEAQQTDYGTDASTAIGIPGVNVEPFESGITTINGTGFSGPMVGYSASLPWIRTETDFDVVSNWNKIVGNHTFKFGANLIRVRDDLLQEQTFSPRGAWDFGSNQTALNGGKAKVGFANNFASFLLDVPGTVGRDLAIAFPAYRQWQYFAYFNDKWQFSPKLTLNLGLRWEFYPPATPHFAGGFSNYDPINNNLIVAGVGSNPLDLGMQKNWKDFAPRFGLSYRLTSHDVFRAGYGISYQPFEDNTYAYDFPEKQNNSFNSLSGYGPGILPDGTPATFAKGFPPPLIAAVPSNGIIPANTPLLINQSYDVVNLHYLDPYIQSWNLSYERALPGQLTLNVAYVGNRGVHVPVTYNLNAVVNPAFFGKGSAGLPLIGFCVPGTNSCRTAGTGMRYAGFSSNYNSLQVQVNRHFTSGFSFTTSYTWGKALGYINENGENANGLSYYINLGRNYARADFDRTQRFVQSYIWELPFGHGHHLLASGPGNILLGGWEVTGILTLQTGGPMSFGCNCKSINTPGNSQSAEQIGSFKKLYGVDTQPWFITSSFVDPTIYFGTPTFGNTGLRTVSGPNSFNLDAAVFRNIRLSERFNVQFRSDWFSATNTPQFSNPNTSVGASSFGLIKGAGGARAIDFGAKLIF